MTAGWEKLQYDASLSFMPRDKLYVKKCPKLA
jgi:hypothetical protein